MGFEMHFDQVYGSGVFVPKTLELASPSISTQEMLPSGMSVSSFSNCFVLPGFADVHVHFREPGFSYKETIRSGSLAAARGGYTDVCTMPNLNPVPDSPAHLQPQLEAIARDAVIRVHPYGAVTVGEQGKELADLEALAPHVVAFSDDGKGIQDPAVMEQAMVRAKALHKIIAAHCEDNALLHGGCIHDGTYARTHGLKGICSESEWGPIARDLELVAKTGCSYHVCHVSTKKSVELIRQAKASGLDVTCETGPHYLLLSDRDLQEDGRFKMNPPLRGEEDRVALLEGLLDGTIDMIATDHAPHSAEEKSRGLSGSLMGVVGLETVFPVLYSGLVLPGVLTLPQLIALLSDNPRRRFGLPQAEDYSVWDLNTEYEIDPDTFLTKGRATPFAGWHVFGRNRMTIAGGKIVWQDK